MQRTRLCCWIGNRDNGLLLDHYFTHLAFLDGVYPDATAWGDSQEIFSINRLTTGGSP